jgi:hypothetical protein
MQNAGHINIDSGHGEWPLGWALLQSLEGDHAVPQQPAAPTHVSSAAA